MFQPILLLRAITIFLLSGIFPLAAAPLVISGEAGSPGVVYSPGFDFPPVFLPSSLINTSSIGAPSILDIAGASGTLDITISAPLDSRIAFTGALAGTRLSITGSYNGSIKPGIKLADNTPSFSFTGLVGNAPAFTSSSSLDWSAADSTASLDINLSATPASAFSFTAVTISFAIKGTGKAATMDVDSPLQIGAAVNGYDGEAPPALLTVAAVPEPRPFLLLGLAAAALLGGFRAKRAFAV